MEMFSSRLVSAFTKHLKYPVPRCAIYSAAQEASPNIHKAGAGGSLFVLVLVLLLFNIFSYGLVLYGFGILFQDSIL